MPSIKWFHAVPSMPLNIAEGNGKWSLKDRHRLLDMARGSALTHRPRKWGNDIRSESSRCERNGIARTDFVAEELAT